MITQLAEILLLALGFVAAMLFLASEGRFRKVFTRTATGIAMVVGIALYGYGYAYCKGFNVISLLRALMALCRMFVGVNDLASIQDAPLMQHPAVLTVFWIAHFLAFFVMASAAVEKLGNELLLSIRTRRLRRGPLAVIYGLNEHSLLFGRSMIRQHWSVLFVDTACPAGMEGQIKSMGAVLESMPSALEPNAAFLRWAGVRPGKRRIRLAVLKEDPHANLAYAKAFLAAMKEQGIQRDQVTLLSRCIGEEAAALQQEGYASVYDFEPHDLTARIAMQEHPPCGMISFDETGRAKENFQAVIVGFGRMGRAVLQHLILNGQFHGSHFRVDVFDTEQKSGWPHSEELMSAYDIRFHAASGESEAFYGFLKKRGSAIRCIALCTGSSQGNAELAEDIHGWIREHSCDAAVLQLTCDSLLGRDGNIRNIWLGDIPDIARMDEMAMVINSRHFTAAGSTPQEAWQRCDYYSRVSCRASADFAPAMFRAAGRTEQEVLDGDWPPDEKTLSHLSMTEHLRWCAFQRVIGYRPMDMETFEARARQWRREVDAQGGSDLRISRDAEHRRHACLVSWEELNTLSARENAITGGSVDYQAMDRENVLALRDVLLKLHDRNREN